MSTTDQLERHAGAPHAPDAPHAPHGPVVRDATGTPRGLEGPDAPVTPEACGGGAPGGGAPGSPRGRIAEEDGSLVTEYGLLAVVAATICGVVIQWASGGAIVRLFNALLNAARDLVTG